MPPVPPPPRFLRLWLTCKTFNLLVSCLKVHNTHTEHFAIALWLPHRCYTLIIRVHNTRKRRQKACVKGFQLFMNQPTPKNLSTHSQTQYGLGMRLHALYTQNQFSPFLWSCPIQKWRPWYPRACCQSWLWVLPACSGGQTRTQPDETHWTEIQSHEEPVKQRRSFVITFLAGDCNAWKVYGIYLFF